MTTTTTTLPGAGGCQVTYAVQSQWPGGFTANLTITNRGSAPINGWRLQWTFANQRVTQAWNATVTQNGQAVTAANMGYNATIPAGGQVSFGFNGTYSGSNPTPTAFTLNGTTCTTA